MDEPTRPEAPPSLLVARVARPHGLEGGLYLRLETDYAEQVLVPGRRLEVADPPAGRPATLTVSFAAPHGRGWRIQTEEIADRAAAEAYAGCGLTVPRDQLSALAEGEYFLHDLMGLEVVDEASGPVGRVAEVYEAPAGVLLGVTVEGREVLVPFQRQVVDEVDLEAGVLKVRLPEGLLDI